MLQWVKMRKSFGKVDFHDAAMLLFDALGPKRAATSGSRCADMSPHSPNPRSETVASFGLNFIEGISFPNSEGDLNLYLQRAFCLPITAFVGTMTMRKERIKRKSTLFTEFGA
jgi:hypothetical protein